MNKVIKGFIKIYNKLSNITKKKLIGFNIENLVHKFNQLQNYNFLDYKK
jgi:hypothetical protein